MIIKHFYNTYSKANNDSAVLLTTLFIRIEFHAIGEK